MPRFTHIIGASESGRTVKSIALKEMRLSRGRFSSLKYSNGILLDGAPAHADVRVQEGQEICAQWEEGPGVFFPEDACQADLCVPYMDEHYLILDKPAPLPTLRSAHQQGPTLENALFAWLGCPDQYVFRPVNRLDKGTSGLMAAARSSHAQQLLQRQLHSASFVREYRALCLGRLPHDEGVIDLPIGTESGVKRAVRPDGARAVTHYWVEEEKNGAALVRLRLETGRTHQIRVHLSALGCPVLGDYLYGQPHPALPGRFALHACRLAFVHPFTGETVERFSAFPPALESIRRAVMKVG